MVVARALLAQINYTADVAANMPPHPYTTGSGIFRCAWRARQNSTTIVLRLRTVYMDLPQPIASCLRSPPEDTKPPFLALQARRLLLLPLPNARACEGWPCSVSRGKTARWWLAAVRCLGAIVP